MKREIIQVSGRDVRLGDEFQDLWFMQGGPAVVKRLDPYKGSLLTLIGEGSQIASFVGTSIQMTLSAKTFYGVSRDGVELTRQPVRGLRRHEKDESQALLRLTEQMNRLHAEMGGRDSRPERKALVKCIRILQKAIEEARVQQ